MSNILIYNKSNVPLSAIFENTQMVKSWPWILGGIGLLLLVAAAVILIVCVKKKKKMEEAFVSELSEDEVAIRIGTVCEIGSRPSQQDCFGVTPLELLPQCGLLAVVADGMGGLADSDRVSQLVVSDMTNDFAAVSEEAWNILPSLTAQANNRVNEMLGPEGIAKSGSTLVAGMIKDGAFYWISVGDSRICMHRNGRLIQLNREHIYRHELQMYAINGEDSLVRADTDPKAGGLTSFLGMGRLRYVDIPSEPIPVRPGDKFILMSDGVYNALDEEELAEALCHNAEEAAKQIHNKIAEKAFRNQDNYTAVILQV